MGAQARRESVARGFLADPSPGVRKFGRCPWKPPAPPRARFFPHGEFREAGAAEAQRGQKTAAETQRKRKGAAKMQREVPACSPLFDRGGHEFPPTPRPRIARGGECAGSKKSKTPPCLGRRTALDAWCIDVGPVGRILKRPVWSPALEAGHSLHGSVPRALARRGPGTASEISTGGKAWERSRQQGRRRCA